MQGSKETYMRVLVGILFAVALSGCEPMGRFPGGTLTGDLKPPPNDWAVMANVETVQLEVTPENPYSVNLWVVNVGSRLYIAAGGGETRWSKQILVEPQVRVRIDHDIYALRAMLVENHSELEEVRQAYLEKYAMASTDSQFNDSLVFRLDR